MIWQPEFTDKLLSRKPGAVQNPRHQHTVTLYAKGLTCEADTLGSCGYVYLAVYPTPETKK